MFFSLSQIFTMVKLIFNIECFPLRADTVWYVDKISFEVFFAIDEINAGIPGSSTLQGSERAGGNGGAAKGESPPGISHTHHPGPPGPATEYPQGTA